MKKICKIEDCGNKHQALGFCDKHYKNYKRHGYAEPKYDMHGMYKSTEYNAWKMMKKRCYYKKYKCWPNYGGRGIKVCERWINSFSNFVEDMGNKPKSEYSLDRINNDGNYEPGNCRWAGSITQNNNQRLRKDSRLLRSMV